MREIQDPISKGLIKRFWHRANQLIESSRDMSSSMNPRDPLSVVDVDLSHYDFLDFGCSTGGSLTHCRKRFKAGAGLGVDIDPAKIREALANGLDALVADPHGLRGTKLVRFVSMMQFLEHLPSLKEVERAIAKAAELATDFLYIHHPSFEDEHFLLSQGLRLYYHDWHGHRTHVMWSDFSRIFERLDLLQYHVRPILPIRDSRSPVVIPSGAPRDQHEYDASRHGPKRFVRFPVPVFQHLEIFVALRAFESAEWSTIVSG